MESDKKGLRYGFEAYERSGTESGGGGSVDRDNFYSVMNQAIELLVREPFFRFKDNNVIEVSRISDALRAVTVIPTRKQLYDLERVPVDLLNDPDDLLIWINVPAWERMEFEKKVRFGLHEVLGILRIPDPLYKYSREMERFVVESAKVKAPSVQVQARRVQHEKVLEMLRQAKTGNSNTVLSLQCEKYDTSHHGFCLIESRIIDGHKNEKIYLVEGNVEDFQKGNSSTSKVREVQLVTDIPPNQVNFVISVAGAYNGLTTVLTREECLARGRLKAKDIEIGNFCVLESYPGH